MTRTAASISLGRASEELFAVPAEGEPVVPANMKEVKTGLEEKVVVSKALSNCLGGIHDRIPAIPDGNRGAILPEITVTLHGREFLVGVKGIGARMPMYGDGQSYFNEMDFFSEPVFTAEAWFGENPWGAMSRRACQEDAGITELAGPGGISGFHICPLVRATPLPGWIMEKAQSRFWYRRLDRPGAYYQQFRLMPSDVRLFYQSESTLGRKTVKVLDAFEINTSQELDHFIDNYIRSGMAALTLIARTLTSREEKHMALDYTDVWLDKDSVIAPDGTIFFADIEGLEWVPVRDENEAAFRMKRQFDRNYYEFMYGLDRLLSERDILNNRTTTRKALRRGLAVRLELALERDGFIELKKSSNSLDIVMHPAEDGMPQVSVRMLDFN